MKHITKTKSISVIVPVYNSEKTIEELITQINDLLVETKVEIILVNDGSKDNSLQICRQVVEKFKNITLIDFTKNFGQHSATMAGLSYSSGDYVLTIDDDLQYRTEDIIEMIRELEKGYDVVFGVRKNKKQSLYRKFLGAFNSVMANTLMDKDKDIEISSFRIFRRNIVDEIVRYTGPYPYIPGLIFRVTRNIGCLLVEHKERQSGESNYTFLKLLKLWLNGFTGFSIKPLRISTIMGLMTAFMGFGLGILLVIRKIINPSIRLGWTSVMVAIVFFSGVQLLSIGIIGEYLGRTFMGQNGMPQFVIREIVTIEDEKKG